MNQALLGKWLWRIREDTDNLWRQIILAKYGLGRDGWDISGPSYRYSGSWKGLVSIKDAFEHCIKFWVGSGNYVLFGHDIWNGDRPLTTQFLDLFRCARDSRAKVKDHME